MFSNIILQNLYVHNYRKHLVKFKNVKNTKFFFFLKWKEHLSYNLKLLRDKFISMQTESKLS